MLRYRTGWRMAIAAGGLLAGLTTLLLAVHLRELTTTLFGEAQSPSPHYLVVSKTIHALHTLGLATATFSDAEIRTLQAQPFVSDIGAFSSNAFPVSTIPGPAMPLYTELFVESVPTRFLDVQPPDWTWKPSDARIPVILSGDFLRLYNLVYAPSQGLPPLSPQTLGMVTIPIRIGPPENHMTKHVRIVGISDRFSSILVPESFLVWANRTFAPTRQTPPSRLVLQVRDPADPAISEFLRTHHYTANREKLRDSTAGAAARAFMMLAAGGGVLLLILALLVSALNAQLAIARARGAIQLLLDLGYEKGELSRSILGDYLVFIILIGLASLGFCHLALMQVRHFLLSRGISLEATADTFPIMLTALAFCTFAFLCQALAVHVGIARMAPGRRYARGK